MLTGTLNIGVTFSFSPIFTETLAVFMKRYPHVRLNIYYKTEVNILLTLVRQSMLVGILSEATTYDTEGIKAIPIDTPDNEMQGCVHTLRNTYRKHSMLEFIKMLSEANAVKERVRDWIR